jgi:hypothetical protein
MKTIRGITPLRMPPHPHSMRHHCLSIIVFASLSSTVAPAQQAIINMPSADITPKGKHFVMHETQTRAWAPDRFWYGTNFYCYGVGKSTELTVTNWNGGFPATANWATGVGFKSSPRLFQESLPHSEVKLTVGQKLIFNHRGLGMGSFTYSHISFRAPKLHTRVSVGGWHGTRQLLKRNTGDVLLGVEQPLDPKERFTWVNEWFRGRHDFGFFITGLLWKPTPHQFVVAAYKFPNYVKNGPSGVVLEYGFEF